MVLSENWFMEGYIDFELQKYRLLAYLKSIKQHFKDEKLYPDLGDLVFHYNNLVAFRERKKLMEDGFPKKLEGINAQKMELVYEKMLADSEIMRELEDIITYSIPVMRDTVSAGAELYEKVEHKVKLEPIGIIPLYKNEGYIFMHYNNLPEVRIYNYNVTLFEQLDSKYRGIRLEFLETRTKNSGNTYEQIKIDLVRTYRLLPNPAVFMVDYPEFIPFDETLLPIAKRMLMRQLAEMGG